MANLSLKFTNRNGRFSICATVVGTTTRHYRIINELRNPDFKTWDKNAQKFVSRRPVDQINNQTLSKLEHKVSDDGSFVPRLNNRRERLDIEQEKLNGL